MAKRSNYESASGVIDVMARNEKAFKLEGSDDWYSVYKAPQMNGAAVGDAVSFEYEEKEKGGQVFRNIQGNVEVEGSSGRKQNRNSSSRSNSSSSSSSAGKVDTTRADAKDNRITRLSILKTSVDLVVGAGDFNGDVDAAQEAVIETAERLLAWANEGAE